MIKCKYCGGTGILEVYKYSGNRHFPEHTVRCKGCGARTLNGKTAQEATDNWNERRFLPVFDSEPATAEEMNYDGVIKCIECILKESSTEYRKLLRDMYNRRYKSKEQYLMLRASIKRCERSFMLSSFVAATGMKGEDIIKQIKREEAEKYAEGRGGTGRRYRTEVHRGAAQGRA